MGVVVAVGQMSRSPAALKRWGGVRMVLMPQVLRAAWVTPPTQATRVWVKWVLLGWLGWSCSRVFRVAVTALMLVKMVQANRPVGRPTSALCRGVGSWGGVMQMVGTAWPWAPWRARAVMVAAACSGVLGTSTRQPWSAGGVVTLVLGGLFGQYVFA